MNEFLTNRYVRLGLLTLLLAALIYTIIFIVFAIIGLGDFPQLLRIAIAVLGAGLLVYKFFAGRIAS